MDIIRRQFANRPAQASRHEPPIDKNSWENAPWYPEVPNRAVETGKSGRRQEKALTFWPKFIKYTC